MAEFGPSYVFDGADSTGFLSDEPSQKNLWTYTNMVLRAATHGTTVDIQPGDWVQAWYGPPEARRVVVGEYKTYASKTMDALVNAAARATSLTRNPATGPWGAMLDVERGKKWFVVDETTNPTLVKLNPETAEKLRKARLDRWLKREFHDMAVAAYLSELKPMTGEEAKKNAEALVYMDGTVRDAVEVIDRARLELGKVSKPDFSWGVPENLPPLTHRRW